MHAEIRREVLSAIKKWTERMQYDNCSAKERLRQLDRQPYKRYKQTMQIVRRVGVKGERMEKIAAEEWDDACEGAAGWKLKVLHECPKPLSNDEEAKLTEDMLAKIGWPETTPPDVVAKATALECYVFGDKEVKERDDALNLWQNQDTDACIAELRKQMPASPPSI